MRLQTDWHFFHVKDDLGRMTVAETFVRERVMLPIGTASYLMWKAFRGYGNGVKRQSDDLPAVSCRGRSSVIRRGCCDGSSNSWAVVTTAAVSLVVVATEVCIRLVVDGASFLTRQEFDNGSDVFSVKRWLDSRSIVLKLRLFFWVVWCCVVLYICVCCFTLYVSFIVIKV